jgi:hypothetical protein
MRERSSKILAILIFTTGSVVANRAAAQGNAAKADDKRFTLEGTVIDEQVVDERGKPVAGASITGIYTYTDRTSRTLFSWEKQYTSDKGRFKFLRERLPLILEAKTPDGRQAGIVRVDADQNETTIRVGPLARASGILVAPSGKPITTGYIRYGIRIPDDPTSGFTQFPFGIALVDSDGNFKLTDLVPGESYMLMYVPRGEWGKVSMTTIGNIKPSSAGEINLGRMVYRSRVAAAEQMAPTGDELDRAIQRQQKISDALAEIADGIGRDFVVRRAPGSNTVDSLLPEVFNATLLDVTGVEPEISEHLMMDVVDFENERVSALILNPGNGKLDRWKLLKSFPKSSGDGIHTVMIGTELANTLKKTAGDQIQMRGEKFIINDIFESPLALENQCVILSRKDFQWLTNQPGEVTAFAITAERRDDETSLEELRKRIEAVQPGLEVSIVRRSGKDQPPQAK